MWTRITLIGCFVLTAIVVFTAVRIEQLNVRSGHLLPRANVDSGDWRVPELQSILSYVDDKIATRRSNEFAYEHPLEPLPEEAAFLGAPYTEPEQRLFDNSIAQHASHSRLHWWVSTMGVAQYALAPLAVLWAAGNFLGLSKLPLRLLSGACGACAFVAIFLMILRGY